MGKIMKSELKKVADTDNIGGLRTKKDTVNLALQEFVQRRKRKEAIELFGKIDFAKDWSPGKARGKLNCL
jgi:hypothetical protein